MLEHLRNVDSNILKPPKKHCDKLDFLKMILSIWHNNATFGDFLFEVYCGFILVAGEMLYRLRGICVNWTRKLPSSRWNWKLTMPASQRYWKNVCVTAILLHICVIQLFLFVTVCQYAFPVEAKKGHCWTLIWLRPLW